MEQLSVLVGWYVLCLLRVYSVYCTVNVLCSLAMYSMYCTVEVVQSVLCRRHPNLSAPNACHSNNTCPQAS